MFVRLIAASKWMINAGQTCIVPDYILAHNQVIDLLVLALEDALTGFLKDPPTTYEADPAEDATLSHIINHEQFQRLQKLLQDTGEKDIVYSLGPSNDVNLQILPTIFCNLPAKCRLMQEEIFRPLLLVVAVKDMAKAIEVVNSKPRPLALYVFMKDKEVEQEFAERTSSGSLVINDVGTQFQMDSLPFGGVGESGKGSYHGKFGFDTFTHMKPVLSNYKDNFKTEDPSRYPPYSKKTQSLLRACLRKCNILDVTLLKTSLKKA